MKQNHSHTRQIQLYERLNRANVNLLKFLRDHPSTKQNPRSDVESKIHMRLLKNWQKIVTELSRFERALE